MLTKKHFKELATIIGLNNDYDTLSQSLIRWCHSQNGLFNENRFIEWIRRIKAKESTVGLG